MPNIAKHSKLPRFLMVCLGLCMPLTAHAFTPTLSSGPPSTYDRSGSAFGRILENEMPGIVNKWSPLVFPPIFKAETKIRPVISKLSGKFTDTSTGVSLDFRDALGHFHVNNWEVMIRAQISRVSLRLNRDFFFSDEFTSPHGAAFEWPRLRVGAGFDLILTRCTRFGVDTDYYPKKPSFASPTGPLEPVSVTFDSPRPVSIGVHLAYNSPDCGTVGWSFDGRVRHSFLPVFSVGSETRFTELELAIGLKSPELVTGTVSVRSGWRYRDIVMISDPFEAHIRWSALFGELVYFY